MPVFVRLTQQALINLHRVDACRHSCTTFMTEDSLLRVLLLRCRLQTLAAVRPGPMQLCQMSQGVSSITLQDSVRKLNMLRGGFADAFKPGRDGGRKEGGKQEGKAAGSGGASDASAFERAVRQRAVDAADALRARARKEIGELPFTS